MVPDTDKIYEISVESADLFTAYKWIIQKHLDMKYNSPCINDGV